MSGVVHGEAFRMLRELPDAHVDLVLTDPPYSSGGQFRGDRSANTDVKYQSSDAIVRFENFAGDNRDQRSWMAWCALWLSECLRVSKPGSVLCMFTDWRQLPSATDAIQAGGWVWRGVAVWDKVVARPQPGRFRAQAEYIVWATNGPRDTGTDGAIYLDGVFRIRTPTTDEREHATQKPLELMEQLVLLAPLGGIVLDPFTGSGTTGVAAKMRGRQFIGFEISEHYCAISRRRLEGASHQLEIGGASCMTTTTDNAAQATAIREGCAEVVNALAALRAGVHGLAAGGTTCPECGGETHGPCGGVA